MVALSRPAPRARRAAARIRSVAVSLGLIVASVAAPAATTAIAPSTIGPSLSATSANLAVIGDFGMNNAAEQSVANLVASWSPDAVLATGDDYYNAAGGTGTGKYDLSVGKYYCAFLQGAAAGASCPTGGTAATNAFWATTGNHDYTDGGGATALGNYLDYFAFPGDERYFNVTLGPVEVFILDSQAMTTNATELANGKAWLESAARHSTASWQIAVFHHPPYSSATHGSTASMQWPFASWGIDLVLNGHDHTYERVSQNGITYVVDGFGGASLYSFGTPVAGSQVRYNGNYGALRLAATTTTLTGTAVSIDNVTRDTFSVAKVAPSAVSLNWSGLTWAVKAGSVAMGPGPNLFGTANAWTDASGYLHLAIAKDANGNWNSGEIVSPVTFGYGTYTFTLGSRVDTLDPNAVLGLFTWSNTPDYANREIDIEMSKWSNEVATNAQYVVQPSSTTNHLYRFNMSSDVVSTQSFTWTAGQITWESRGATGNLIASYTYTGADVPPTGDERVDLNLWLYRGVAPANGTGAEVIVRSFAFTPAVAPNPPGAFAKSSPTNGKTNVNTNAGLSWAASTGATTYEWCVWKTGSSCASWTSTTARTATARNLLRRTGYTWQVRAVNGAGTTAANGGTTWTFTTK